MGDPNVVLIERGIAFKNRIPSLVSLVSRLKFLPVYLCLQLYTVLFREKDYKER